ncbi:MAG: hypothetical protein OIF55_09750 [Amphritea sp.]|nr:hypothetical protein [Amphritea sp.]
MIMPPVKAQGLQLSAYVVSVTRRQCLSHLKSLCPSFFSHRKLICPSGSAATYVANGFQMDSVAWTDSGKAKLMLDQKKVRENDAG